MSYSPSRPSRRCFLWGATAVAGWAASAMAGPLPAVVPACRQRELCVFTKPFNSMSFADLAAKVKELGFQGIEAPIRKGGHVEPAQVEDRLPALMAALQEQQLSMTILTSDINDPDDPLTERVLRTAAGLGIKRYRLQYFRYQESRPLGMQLRRWTGQLKALAQMNHDLGIQGLYQNHSGRQYFGAPIWDLAEALQEINPADLGVAYDLRHATVEGGLSWPVSFRRIEPHVRALYMKDFVWNDQGQVQNVPLGQGRVDAEFLRRFIDAGFDGPISLHEEYIDHRSAELVPRHWEAIEQDLATLQRWLP